MCFGSRSPAPPPPAAAPKAIDPVMTNLYDPEVDDTEKGAVSKKAKGTSQLKVELDPTVASMDKGTGLQIT